MTYRELRKTTIIFALAIILFIFINIKDENYIQNIETKLNIYNERGNIK